MPNVVGGPHDTVARAAAQSLSQTFGQPVIIDNRPAGNGVIGTLGCAKAPPDGYSICSNSLNYISLNPFLIAKLPYDPPRDLAPIIKMGTLNSALVVSPSLDVANVKDLLDAARAKPGTITWSSFGSASVGYLLQQWLKVTRGIVFVDVPYKAAGQGLNATIAGEVLVASYALGGVTPIIKAGKVKVLAVSGAKRSTFLPDVPTLKEQGIELDVGNWFGYFVPAAATPRQFVQRFNTEFGKLLADPAFVQKILVGQGFDPEPPNSPEEFASFLKTNREMCENLVKTIGIKPE